MLGRRRVSKYELFVVVVGKTDLPDTALDEVCSLVETEINAGTKQHQILGKVRREYFRRHHPKVPYALCGFGFWEWWAIAKVIMLIIEWYFNSNPET